MRRSHRKVTLALLALLFVLTLASIAYWNWRVGGGRFPGAGGAAPAEALAAALPRSLDADPVLSRTGPPWPRRS